MVDGLVPTISSGAAWVLYVGRGVQDGAVRTQALPLVHCCVRLADS
jgi:hypothetical protein